MKKSLLFLFTVVFCSCGGGASNNSNQQQNQNTPTPTATYYLNGVYTLKDTNCQVNIQSFRVTELVNDKANITILDPGTDNTAARGDILRECPIRDIDGNVGVDCENVGYNCSALLVQSNTAARNLSNTLALNVSAGDIVAACADTSADGVCSSIYEK